MKKQGLISVPNILLLATKCENSAGARERRVNAAEANVIYETAKQALQLARRVNRVIRVWNRRAMPTAYRWSKWKFSQYVITARPNGWMTLEFERVNGPTNSKSFIGTECSIDGLEDRDVRWMAGRQRQRVLRFDSKLIEAVERCG
jgi:hypothetical protein